jgi:hypothetical protein
MAQAQTKSDRSAAAKKAAATRQRNQQQTRAQEAGKKAAGTRQRHEAGASAGQAKHAAKGAFGGAAASVRFAGEAVKQAGKLAASTVGAGKKREERK